MINQHGRLNMVVVVIVCLVAAGCASTPLKKAPRVATAERHLFRGITALAQHRFTVADGEFTEAYMNYAAVEDFPGMVTVLINSSRLYRKQGQADRSAASMDQANGLVSHVPELAAEVWFEKGKIAIMGNDADTALVWAEKSLQVAGEDNRAMILNFCAVIRLQKNEVKRAEELAMSALKESRGRGDRHEETNALRTLAEIALSRGAASTAEAYYRDALTIDKALADSAIIHDDLKGLATTMQLAGNRQSAADYLVRAADVALAGGDASSALADYSAAAVLCEQVGDTTRAAVVADKMNLLRKGLKGSIRP